MDLPAEKIAVIGALLVEMFHCTMAEKESLILTYPSRHLSPRWFNNSPDEEEKERRREKEEGFQLCSHAHQRLGGIWQACRLWCQLRKLVGISRALCLW